MLSSKPCDKPCPACSPPPPAHPLQYVFPTASVGDGNSLESCATRSGVPGVPAVGARAAGGRAAAAVLLCWAPHAFDSPCTAGCSPAAAAQRMCQSHVHAQPCTAQHNTERRHLSDASRELVPLSTQLGTTRAPPAPMAGACALCMLTAPTRLPMPSLLLLLLLCCPRVGLSEH